MQHTIQGLKGAQVLQASLVSMHELFYVSPLAADNPDKPIRGGIPLLFPQFGDSGSLVKHGFVRDMYWQCVEEAHDGRGSTSTHQLEIKATDFTDWPHAASLKVNVSADEKKFMLGFSVTNVGDSSFTFTGGLHPYFRISSRADIELKGLESMSFKDSFPEKDAYQLQSNCLIERQYVGTPDLTFYNGNCWLKLVAKGFDSWMVWNPGVNGARLISDLPDEDWDTFMCIEPIILSQPLLLEPGKTFNGDLTIELMKDAQ